MPICSVCKKRQAIVFTSRYDNGKRVDEGYCIKCAYESGIAGISDMFSAAGINDQNIEEMSDRVEDMLSGGGNSANPEDFLRSIVNNDFDDVYTAPVHGFLGAIDYWTRCSAKAVLGGVRVPLLALNAKNDPFQPPSVLPKPADVSAYVYLDQPEEGGHIGFPVGKWPFSLEYLPHRIFRFFEQGT